MSALGPAGLLFRRLALGAATEAAALDPAHAAQAALLQAVFGTPALAPPGWAPPASDAFACFEAGGRCIASVETFALPLLIDGACVPCTGIRSVAVHPAWRGRGLFRDLMGRALAAGAARHPGMVLLYTDAPDLYRPFGFEPCPQHAFVGPPPAAQTPAPPARRLSLDTAADRALIDRLLASRTPVSHQVAVAGGSALFRSALVADADLTLDYVEAFDALVVTDPADTDTLRLVDLVAAVFPPLAAIVASLAAARQASSGQASSGQTSSGQAFWQNLATLFPPDRLAWSGRPEQDDTGLMIRGPRPAAFERPFMLPPTTEF